MKRLAAYAAVIFATLAVLIILWYFGAVVLLFILSLFVAAAVRPVIDRLADRGLSPGLAMVITYLLAVTVLGIWLYVVGSPVISETEALINDASLRYADLHPQWLDGNPMQSAIASRLPAPDRLSQAIAAQEGTLLAQTSFTFLSGLLTGLSAVIVVLVLSVYWNTDSGRIENLGMSLLPARHRVRARQIWRAVETGVGAFIRSEVLQAFLAALLLAIGFLLMQVPYPTLLALVGAVTWLIPIVGFFFAVLPAFLAGASVSLGLGVAAAAYTILVLVILERVVEPRLFNRHHLYSSLLVVLLMIPLVQSYGFFALFAASPLAVAIEIFLVRYFARRRVDIEPVYPEARLRELESQLVAIRGELHADGAEMPAESTNLINRLEALLRESEAALGRSFHETPPG